MKVRREVEVAQPLDDVWAALCAPVGVIAAVGDGLVRDGDEVTGPLTLRLGSTQVSYRISATGERRGSDADHKVRAHIHGVQARGDGELTVVATLAVLPREGDGVEVSAAGPVRLRGTADIRVTGRGESASEQAWGRALETALARVAAALMAGDTPARAATAPAIIDEPSRSSTPSSTAPGLDSAVATSGHAITPVPPPAPQPAPLLAGRAHQPTAARTASAGPGSRRSTAMTVGAAAGLLMVLMRARRRHRRSAVMAGRRRGR